MVFRFRWPLQETIATVAVHVNLSIDNLRTRRELV
jgi:hypothetical protein